MANKSESPAQYWAPRSEELLDELQTGPAGLSSSVAEVRLTTAGANTLRPPRRAGTLTLFLAQFKSPIILILVFAAVLSAFLGDAADTAIILAIVLISGLLGFFQERSASQAMEKLLAIVRVNATVLRDGLPVEVALANVVPGDVTRLAAGDIVPGDARLLEAHDLYVDEAALTGETFPVEKLAGDLPADTPLARRRNVVYEGTHVVSGTATAVVVSTGPATEFGQVAERLRGRPPETEFERGVRRFGYLLMEITLLLVIAIFAINVFLQRPVLDSFLFALALAVGLTPQLLPAIISINLSHGARRMAENKVIVRRLSSIENLGSMQVLCSDKTGTLTEGVVHLHAALDARGQPSDRVLFYAYLNAAFETGFANPIDEAIRGARSFDVSAYRKLDEVPYDFVRRRLSILVEGPAVLPGSDALRSSLATANGGVRTAEAVTTKAEVLMITKGALLNVLAVCTRAEDGRGNAVDLDAERASILQRYHDLSAQGYRTLGVAYRLLASPAPVHKDDERDLTFAGFITLHDPPKQGIGDVLAHLRQLGVGLKVITGDNQLVAASVSAQVGLASPRILTGNDLRQMPDEALRQQAPLIDIFAEVEPNQKERIIGALRHSGAVVGYMGDGINDASALHLADVGISVDTAVDVAKEAADIVLLEKDLSVLEYGIREGRSTFANTLKYIFMATSANFGNMFSMAGASLFLSFLPLLPKQILLTNLLTDFPEATIANDRVDHEWIDRPRRWDLRFIRRFMLVFGPLSSVFDYLTFGGLLLLLHANPAQFRSGWFVESVLSASMVVLIVRTRRPFFRSRPGRGLALATLLIALVTAAVPYSPLAAPLGFVPLPASYWLAIAIVLVLYATSAEAAKRVFYRYAE